MSDLLTEANEIVNGERAASYGHPYDNFTHTAALWSAYLGFEITAEQVAVLMMLVKISREKNKHKRDNLVDVIGYVLTLEKVIDRREEINANNQTTKESSKEVR